MKNLKKSKQFVLIFLITFPIMLALSSFITNVRGGPDIPNPHQDNGWHWGVDVEDRLYFETEILIKNGSSPSQEVLSMSKFIQIMNITSIENVTIDLMGEDKFSRVNFSMLYHDPVDKELKPFPNMEPTPLAHFVFNDSHPFKERYFTGPNLFIPIILPINDTWDNEVDVLDDIINNTMYTTFYNMGFMNSFNEYGSIISQNKMWFRNSSDGYYINATYNSDGTLDSCIGTYLQYDLMSGTTDFLWEIQAQKVFDYNMTDGIDWGVDIGDILYYDQYDDSDGYQDIKMDISGFNYSLYEMPAFMGGMINLTFYNVLANISIWDGVQYVFSEENKVVGSANNFYPINLVTAMEYVTALVPENMVIEDFTYIMDFMTLFIPFFPFDQYFYEMDGNYLLVEMNSTTSNDFTEIKIDTSTGILESLLQIVDDDVHMAFLRKDMPSSLQWSVQPGDVIYFNSNTDEVYHIRATILGFIGAFFNMTEIEEDSGMFEFPPDHPEFQFFSAVIADIEEWDPGSELWVGVDTLPIGIANTYWPMAPMIFEILSGPSLIMPIGTTGADFLDLYDMFSFIYDEVDVGTNFITFRNTTMDIEMSFYFDVATGKLTYFGGNAPSGPELPYMSVYPKFNETLTTGLNNFQFQSDFITDITITVELEISVGGPTSEYIYAFIPFNPVGEPLPNGTALAFFDQLITQSDLIVGNITMTITFTSVDLNEIELHFFAWNVSGMAEWSEAPPDFYSSIIYDYGANSLTIEFPGEMFRPEGIISAMSYIPIGAEEKPEPIIPGYNLFFFVIGLIIISAILIKKRRK